MAQGLRLRETLASILTTPLVGSNQAVTRERAVGRPLFYPTLLWRNRGLLRGRCSVVSWRGLQRACVVSTRPRQGPTAWEVDRLYLPRVERDLDAVLEAVAQRAGQQGAVRVFLRVTADGSTGNAARMAGFFPCYQETLFEGRGGRDGLAMVEDEGLQKIEPCHHHGLFQLYCASTPADVRQAVGVTFDQWRDAEELVLGRRQEMVYQKDGKVRGLVRVSRWGGTVYPEVVAHPDDTELLPCLVQRALAHKGRQVWLVPHYQELLRRLLLHWGFTETASYAVLVKTVAAQVRRPQLGAMEAKI